MPSFYHQIFLHFKLYLMEKDNGSVKKTDRQISLESHRVGVIAL